MALTPDHPDYYTQALQFTATIHRSVPPSLQPTAPLLTLTAGSRRVLVTGAGSGFGRAAALQWARAGSLGIVLCGRRKDSLEIVKREIESLAKNTSVVVAQGDVSVEADVQRIFKTATGILGGVISVVVHAAGVLGPMEKIGNVDVDAWWDSVTINLKSCFLASRELIRSVGDGEATFVHVGTVASYMVNPGQSSYMVGKAADNKLIEQLHAEYANLRVFNVHPGMAESSVLPKGLELYAQDAPELFGSFSIFLASPQADFLRGRFMTVNWDIDELIKYKDAIVEEGLLQSQLFKANLGPGGHFKDPGVV